VAKKKRKKRASKKKATKRTGRPKGGSGVNKSQAIRDYMAAHPRAKPKAVAAALVEQGVQVTPMFVSAVKTNAKKQGRQKVRGAARRPGLQSVGGATTSLSIDHLVAAKRFVDSVGGVARARAAMEAVELVSG